MRAFAPQHGGARLAPQSYLGIDVRDVAEEEVTLLKLRDSRGAEIVRVDHDGPAGKMGLRERDVVLQMNGVLIDGEEQLRRMLKDCAPGKSVVLLISRDGQTQIMTAQMADKGQIERDAWEHHLAPPQAPANALPTGEGTGASVPAPPEANSKYSKSFLGSLLTSPTYTGAMLELMGPQMAQFFGVQDGTGLLVRRIDASSPAAIAGLHPGDYVVKVNAKTVRTLGDWTRTVREAKGRPIVVVIMREKQERTLTITPDFKRRSMLEVPFAPERVVWLACRTTLQALY